MRSTHLFLVALVVLSLMVNACAPSKTKPTPQGSQSTPVSSASGEWLSAKEAVALAYAALTTKWKSAAKLAFVGRYSRFCNVDCSPLLVEKDTGIGSDGRQTHWIVIFADGATYTSADVFYVEKGKAKLVASDIATIRPAQLFDLEGWVDSTEIQFRSSQRVGLELKTNEPFVGIDADLEAYPLLWLAETSFGRYDIYDATTGKFIKSR